MKKVLSLVLAAAMLLLLVGCSDTSGDTSSNALTEMKFDFLESPMTVNIRSGVSGEAVYTFKITFTRYEITQEYSGGTCDVRIHFLCERINDYAYSKFPNDKTQYSFKYALSDLDGVVIANGKKYDLTVTLGVGDKKQDYLTFNGLDTNKTYTIVLDDVMDYQMFN